MAVTRSWETRATLHLDATKPPVPPERRREFWLLLGATLLIGASLAHVYFAKTQDLRADDLVNLNTVTSADELLPVVHGDRDVADKLWTFLQRVRPIANAGTLARAKLFPVSSVKPLIAVRTPREYTKQYVIWTAIFIAAFWIVHLVWRWARFRGDPLILPAILLLTGLGLTLAVSLRDPLRDTLEFSKFAWGVSLGCALLLLPLLRLFHTDNFSRWIYTPLLASFALFAALVAFGSGPTGSDSKVNLGPFQPVELIKILVVFFMAGYFARRWEWLRELREKRFVPRWLQWLELPRFAQTLPVMCAVALALAMFFLLKDLGPALVTGFLFLAMFAIARGRAALPVIGIALLVTGVAIGYRVGTPHTVVDRISMWLLPWDNDVHGGDQLAHAEWAFATGGPLGSGPGWGDPGMIPAGHTDLVLPAIGEEWGFAGVVSVFLLFGILFWRAIRAALDAQGEYDRFLGLGLATLIAFEMLLISAGVLGAMPLSGVVSPFLSSGNTAMLSNFLIFALILGISSRPAPSAAAEPFRKPVRALAVVVALAGVVLTARAAWLQLLHDREIMARDTLVFTADGVRRPQHNPRLNSLARELTRGAILDRNGVVLASSNERGERVYPYGDVTAHIVGDLRTGENFHATNASLVEHDMRARLQGFATYAELADAVRYRHQPNNPVMQALRARDRSVHTTIDIRLQVRATEILNQHLEQAGRQHGALVVMNADTGDVLALASETGSPLDRARYGQYPPGSTFKLVTAIAALRKDPALKRKTFHCGPLPGGRVGTMIPGWSRPIRDDVGDSAHGSPDLMRAITVSCNAYFAQLGVHEVGAKALDETARLLEIPDSDPAELKKMLPFASYGQGPIVITPFKMARVSAMIARGGGMPQGRWVLDANNDRTREPVTIVTQDVAEFLAESMRSVVTAGTGRRAMAGLDVAVAGKTGTAQVGEGEPHSWFTGFAPYDSPPAQRIAFAVVIEHGGYGAQAAAPVARDLVMAARDLGILPKSEPKSGR